MDVSQRGTRFGISIDGEVAIMRALEAKVKSTKDKAILWARRWSVNLRNNAANRLEWRVFGTDKGGRGVTGALRRSIQFSLTPEEKQVTSLVGISRNSPAINYARYIEGPPAIPTVTRRHFLSFSRHPEFLRWARAHGIKVKTTRIGKLSPAGLMVGGRAFPFMHPAFEALGDEALKDGLKIAE